MGCNLGAGGNVGSDEMRTITTAWFWIVLLGALVFLDVPLLTLRKNFVAERRNERLVLMSIEVNLVLLWAMAKFFFGLERALVTGSLIGLVEWVGLAVTLLGVALAASGKIRLGRWFSATLGVKQGHRLITAWPYSWVRHPVYAGLVIAIVGSALTWNSLLTLVLGVLLVAPLWFHTHYEELLFEQHFGDEFRTYRERVPRLVPFSRRHGNG